MDEQGRPERSKDGDRFGGAPVRIRGDADIQRLALLHGGVQSAERFLEWGVGVEAMVIEDIDVVDAKPAQALLQARKQVFSRAEIAVRPRPHVPAGFGRDHQLIAVRRKSVLNTRPKFDSRASVWRPVVVGEVEMRDTEVERPPQDLALDVNRATVPEVLPQSQRDCGKVKAAAATASVGHRCVAIVRGDVIREVSHP